jgi:Putative beta barrel porin-7 (BBP7)
LFVVLSLNTSALATAQDAKQSADARVCQADLAEDLEVVSAAHGDDANQAVSGGHLQRVSSVSDPAVLSAEQRPSMDSIAKSPDGGHDGSCCPSCNDACRSVYVDIEALFMGREPRFARHPIVIDANTGATFLSTSDLDFNFDPGLRATVGMRLCDGLAVEFSYFGLFQGNASAIAVKPDSNAFLTFPDNLVGNVFVDIDRAQVNYSSWVNSFEVNFPCCCGCCDECRDECGCSEIRCRSLTWFGGFRYLNLSERLNISAERNVSGAVEEGTYNVRTTDDLFGAQLGARLRRSRGRFGCEATGKAGIFGNDAQENQSVTDFPNFPLRPNVSSSRGEVAFVGETNLSAFYRLTDVWNLRAGYSVMWIEGLALAPDQLDFNFAASPSGNQLHNGGGMFLHGVNFGLEARW